MEVSNYPFADGVFNNTTSVLLDACFLLALIDETDNKYHNCNETMIQLCKHKPQTYVTNVVSAEVLNILMVKLFKADMMSKIDNNETLNTRLSINHLMKHLKPRDKAKIANKNHSAEKISFKYYFNKIYKSEDKNLLNVYVQKAIFIQKEMEKAFNIKYISMSRDYFEYSRDLMSKHLLMVNDAAHLAVSERTNLTYIMSLDSDFVHIGDTNIKLLKI